MRTISELLIIIATLSGGFVYLSTEFASASDVEQLQGDVSEIKAMVTADSIQRRMMRYCDNHSPELKLRIETERLAYQITYARTLEWICEP